MKVTAMLVLLGSLSLGACAGQPQFAATTAALPRAAIAPATVEVLLSRPPARPYAELGMLSVTGRTSDSLVERLARMRDAGADHGCNAVLVNAPTSSRGWYELTATCVGYQ